MSCQAGQAYAVCGKHKTANIATIAERRISCFMKSIPFNALILVQAQREG